MAKHIRTRRRDEKSSIGKRVLKILKWVGIGIGGILAVIVIGFLTVFYTPFFPKARTQYVLMTLHTSNPWLATFFFSQETIDKIVEDNRVEAPVGSTDTGMIKTNPPSDATTVGTTATGTAPAVSETPATVTTEATTVMTSRTTAGGYHVSTIYEDAGMDILQMKESGYVARLIRVKDPSRVKLGLCDNFMVKGKYG